jgi:cell division protein FtsL
MASLSAEAAQLRSPARRKPPQAASKPKPRARARRRVSSGVVWIAVFAVLFAGIVAVNVAVLQANLRLDKLGQQRADLQAQNAALASELSAAAAGPRIGLAATKLGLTLASSQDTSYVEIAP